MRRTTVQPILLLVTACVLAVVAMGDEPSLSRGGGSAGGESGFTGDPAVGEPSLQFSEEASVSWVLVAVVVKDRRGHVRDLGREQFRLSVDGQPVSVESFDVGADAPLSLVFLQDLSGSMANGGKLEASREALRFFLDDARPGDEFAVASFASGRTEVEVPFTADLGAVRDAVGRWQGYGTTALHDAVGFLPEIQIAGRHPKRAAILVTDGVDNASELTPDESRSKVIRARLPVYVLAFDRGRPSAKATGVRTAASLLETLAEVTGGGYFPVADPDQFKELWVRIAADLRYQYVLGFQTRGSGSLAEHRIEVELEGMERGVELTHRESYRGFSPRD